MSLARRWAPLAIYVVAIYATLPYGPRLGLRVARTGPGAWLLGPGLPLLALLCGAALIATLWRRRAPVWAYGALAAAAIAYALTFSWLRVHHLERTHLPEYGLAAWLAWRALEPLVPSPLGGYAAAAALGAAIGFGDELLQGVLPNRYYDIRDVAMNALGAVLGMVVLAAMRAAPARHKAADFSANAEIATRRPAT